MKTFLSTLFILFLHALIFGQKDKEHWFAPMKDQTNNPDQYQRLYLSTDRATDFPVYIYNNNILVGTVVISKGNPQKFDIIRDQIITTLDADLFRPINKGIHVKADFEFFANLRFSVLNHAEIVTSKGRGSMGTQFYAVVAPAAVSASSGSTVLNFMTSIIATEDNTSVTVSGYKSTVQFSNGTTGATHPTLTFTLNKGQSYIIEGKGNLAGNLNGFIGAKIVADKLVTVTNGNFNGQYSGNLPNNTDIVMDQAVSVDRLGQEFIIVKGNGTIGRNTEGALIVATENNTQIFVNDETVALSTLNEGQYFVIPDTKYKVHNGTHYNMAIRTTKNAYVYQLLAGDNGASEAATLGFNFIPPLNCYLPRKIDELGLIDENYIVSNGFPGGILNIPTRLNMITQKGAAVTVNGATPATTTGPFDVTGNANWVSYSIPNVTGNLTITSDRAITAGISAGNDAAGYGGYFAGFSSIPIILKLSGICIPDLILEVSNGFDSYQWYFNGQVIPGANSHTYTPQQPGNYTVQVVMNGCPPLMTVPYVVASRLDVKNDTIYACYIEADVNSGKFDLTTANVTVGAGPFTKKYYTSQANAISDVNPIANPNSYVTTSGSVVYVRVMNEEGCYSVAKITLLVKPPKYSTILKEKYICIDARTSLDAGPGYTSYEWSTGATTQSISGVSVGEYWVKLGHDGCFTLQKVKVTKLEDPVIQGLEITHNNVAVHAVGGTPPYQYSVDNLAWQTSNLFTGLSRGNHTFSVKDANDCSPVSVEVTVPNLINAITPNGDNFNDYVDYKELAFKDNFKFTIFDRYENQIFTGDRFTNYKWDGRHFDKKIVTGSYWYVVTWNESDRNKTPIKYTGWILVKNRD